MARGSGAKVLLLEVWPPGRPGLLRRLVWSEAVLGGLHELNRQLRGLASPEVGVRVCDLFHEAGMKIRPSHYLDTLHFSAEMYRQLGPAMEAEIGRFLEY